MKATTLHNKPSAQYADKLKTSIQAIQAAVGDQAERWTQAHSLGAEDVVVTHLLSQAGVLPQMRVFVLQTGKLHMETLSLLPVLERHFGIRLVRFEPEPQAVVQFVRDHGERAMFDSVALRKACCELRKMVPLRQALADKIGWVTGLRREQSNTRAEVPILEQEAERAKLNPLADWTWGDVWHCIAQNALPYNPLHDAFFPSIGCEPCTRAISLGEDFRAGRWWWEDSGAKECGLHVKPHASDSSRTAGSAQAHVGEADVKDAIASGRSQHSGAKECGLHVKPTPHTPIRTQESTT